MLIQTDGATVLAALLADIKTKRETKLQQQALEEHQLGMKPKISYQKLWNWHRIPYPDGF